MSKVKTFVLGALFGCFLLTGMAFASEKLHLEVDVPQVSIWLDDRLLYTDHEQGGDMELPLALEHSGTPYVQLPAIAEALGKAWKWDDDNGSIVLESPEEAVFIEIEPEDMTNKLSAWVESSLLNPHTESRIINGDTYILITRGTKNTGGYNVSVERIEHWNDSLKVYMNYIDPKKGDLVTQGITHPYTLVKVDGVHRNIKYEEL